MPQDILGTHLFAHYAYGGDLQPQLIVLNNAAEDFTHFAPRGKTLTLNFDTSKRFCTGWHDLATAKSYPCPTAADVPAAYTQCHHCRTKTGFNPAFYNASSVSEQQQARNAEPHLLYLAHFAPGVVKVGISWAQRELRRLLDQGARSCLILKTYPNANIARQYEAKIAKIPGIAETLKLNKKYMLLERDYDASAAADELNGVREKLIDEVGIAPDNNSAQHLDNYYFHEHIFTPQQFVLLKNEHTISGKCIGMNGGLYLAEQNGTHFGLPLGAFDGYRVTISEDQAENNFEPQQASLF